MVGPKNGIFSEKTKGMFRISSFGSGGENTGESPSALTIISAFTVYNLSRYYNP